MNRAPLEQKAAMLMKREAMLPPGATVLVALSGGADSMALLHVLLALRETFGIREIAAAHVNHGLRGDEAVRDEVFVRETCAALGVRLFVCHADVRAQAAAYGEGVEEAGRRVRYAFLQQTAAQLTNAPAAETQAADAQSDTVQTAGTQRQDPLSFFVPESKPCIQIGAEDSPCRIATAHTLSDNAETLLFHMARGCGPDGLCGIPPVRGNVIRPLLTCSRAEVEAYCAAHGLMYVTDSTNADIQYARNRLRCYVLPELAAIRPCPEEALGRLAARMREETDYMREKATEALQQAALPNRPGELAAYDAARLSALHPAVRARALHTLLTMAGEGCEERHVVWLEQHLRQDGALTLPGARRVRLRQNRLSLQCTPEQPACRSVMTEEKIVHPGDVFTIGDKKYRIFLISLEKYENPKKVHNSVLKNTCDYAMIKNKLILRTRQPGDHYRPVGRGGTKSLKKLLNEAKIPLAVRAEYPVLWDDEGIVLVPECGCDERVRVTPGTRQLLVLETIENNG